MNQHWTTVNEAIEWIHSLEMHGIKPGLKRMAWMLERLNNPERRMKFIHIGGTNGKGSTLSFMRHVLEESGYEVGTFTSPYLIRFQNRIQLNGQDIPDEHLLALTQKVKPLAEELATSELGSPTAFEIVTVIAILYFATVAYPDFVLWEVGLGGRLDSTNVVMPILSVITNVGHDHIHILGDSIEQIAAEKAGIIKPGVPVVTGVQHPRALRIIEEKAVEKKSALYPLGSSFTFADLQYTENGQQFTYVSPFNKFERIPLQLQGEHQFANASIALMALEVLKQYYAVIWEEDELRRGLQNTRWEGRFETVHQHPLIIIDGAHNLEGMQAVAQTLQNKYKNRAITVLFSALKGKAIAPMLQPLEKKVETIILTEFDFPRAAHLSELMEEMKGAETPLQVELIEEKDWKKAINQMIQDQREDAVYIITGSLYFISQVRAYLIKQ